MKNRYHWIWILPFMLISLISISQNHVSNPPSVAASYINFKKISYLEGLPQDAKIYSMTTDSIGFLWLATFDGLYRYDGLTFELVDFPVDSSQQVLKARFSVIHCSKNNIIWAGTMSNGIYAIDAYTGAVEHFYWNKHQESGIIGNRIIDIAEDDEGGIWLSIFKKGVVRYDTQQGDFETVSIYDHKKGTVEQANDDIRTIEFAAPYLWLGTSTGLYRYHTKARTCEYFRSFVHEAPTNKTPLSEGETAITDIKCDEYHRLWLCTYGGGLSMIDLATDEYFNYKTPSRDFQENIFYDIDIKSKDEIWVTAGQRQLAIFNIKKGVFTPLKANLGNSNYDLDQVFDIYFDKKNKRWWFGGEALFTILPQRNQFEVRTFPFTLWILTGDATENILYSANSISQPHPTVERINLNDFSYQHVPYFPKKKKNSWAGGLVFLPNGKILLRDKYDIFEFNPISNRFQPWLNFDTSIKAATYKGTLSSFLDSKNRLWVGTKDDGLFCIDIATKSYQHFTKKSTPSIVENGWIHQIYEDREGRIWYVTDDGFGYFDDEKADFINFSKPDYQTNHPSKDMQIISCIIQDRNGRFWVGNGRGGFGYFDYKEGKTIQISILDHKDGLRNDKVDALLMDKNGHIWGDNDDGIFRLDVENMTFENFGMEYGWFENGVVNMHLTADNRIWLSFRNNVLASFSADSLQTSTESPSIYLKHFYVFNDIFKRNIYQNDKIKLSYQQNFFSISFGAFNFFNPKQTQFAYQLEGIDKDWVIQQQHIASYTNIKGGNYTFKVKARLENGKWGETKEILVVVTPPFWATWWFYSLIGIFLLGLAYWWYQSRIQQIKKQEALKTAFNKQIAEVQMSALRAQMNPHFLFNCLNSIKLFIMENDNDAASIYLTKFARLIRLILNNSKSHFVHLHNELKTLELYIQMEAMRLDHRFNYEIEIAPDLDIQKIEVPPLLLQPYVENAIWHGLATKKSSDNLLKISISTSESTHGKLLNYIVEDNGIGRAAARNMRKNRPKQQQSFGLTITKNRIELTSQLYDIKTEVNIIDLFNEAGEASGTRVELSIPLVVISSSKP